MELVVPKGYLMCPYCLVIAKVTAQKHSSEAYAISSKAQKQIGDVQKPSTRAYCVPRFLGMNNLDVAPPFLLYVLMLIQS